MDNELKKLFKEIKKENVYIVLEVMYRNMTEYNKKEFWKIISKNIEV